MENIRVDQLSFWIGFAAATLFWWLVRLARPAFSSLKDSFGQRIGSMREGLSANIETRFRQDILKLMQDKHLAGPLFSINEIAVEPLLLMPPPPVVPGEALPPESLTDIAVPYMPEWPEVNSQFHVNRMSIPMAMSKGANLLLIGKPGSGRTFALNLIASRVAQRHPDVGELGDYVPILVHCGELDLSKRKEKPLDVLYKAYTNQVSMLVEAQLDVFIEKIFELKLCLLLVDGLDEILPEKRSQVVKFIQTLQEKYPGNRYILTSSEKDLSSQEKLNLHPFGVAGWTQEEKQTFIKRWGELWLEHITTQSWASALPEIFDTVILNQWLMDDTQMSSPFTITLQTWAAYAGDSRGPGEIAAVEAYLNRMTTGIQNGRPAMENLAAQSVINATPFMVRRQASAHIAAFEVVAPDEDAAQSSDEQDTDLLDEIVEATSTTTPAASDLLDDNELDALLDELDDLDVADEQPDEAQKSKKDAGKPGGRSLLPQLTDAEILRLNSNDTYSFSHPMIAGYLAGTNLKGTETISALYNQPDWAGKELTQHFLPYYKAEILTVLGEAVKNAQKDPLQSELITIASWLKYASKSATWRNQLLRNLANTLKKDSLPIGMRARLLAALATSGEAGINTLFRNMLESDQHSVRWLGSLGCALTKDKAAIPELGHLAHDTSVFVSRAACLALVTIGTTPALEHLTTALLDGSDEVRRAAAEALALHPEEGHPVLRDGAQVENVAVRRAVIFGLARVSETWAQELLALKQVEDDQWIVRNAAVQAQEDLKLVEMTIPTTMPPLHEIGWLIKFAGDKGMGLSPGQASWDMLATALKEGSDEAQLAAMHIYRRKPNEAYPVIENLLQIMGGPEGEIRESAYHTLWHLKGTGLPLTVE